jgi:preprotein translocase SecF subunit
MFHIVEKRRWYFLLSALIIIPGLIAMIYTFATKGRPFDLAIDFTGGSLWELKFDRPVEPNDLREVFTAAGIPDPSITTVGVENTLQVRLPTIEEAVKLDLMEQVRAKFGSSVEEVQYSLVGPAIGREVTRAAALAIVAASVAILLFMIVAFRKVSSAGLSPWKFGATAIAAMVHDILVTMGFVSIMSLLFGWQADALFLTALLTVIGFSVQDTIVVFDRVRENSLKYRGESFTSIANRSLTETMHRSLATQLNAMFIMIAILLFGGATIKQFITVMLVGLLSGTYSSIFNATPLLVGWEERDLLGRKTPAKSG